MAFERIVLPNPTATINVHYNPGFSPQSQVAFQRAVDIWQTLIISPITINVEAFWQPNSDPNNLGSANAFEYRSNFNGAPSQNINYPVALANSLANQDLNPQHEDIVTNFNSNRTDWFFNPGTPENPNIPGLNQYDLTTVVLHELGHALGFASSLLIQEASPPTVNDPGRRDNPPRIFDQFIENGGGQNLTNTTLFPDNTIQLRNELISNNLFLNSPAIRAVNNGNPARIFAPGGWIGGSSISHLDENTYSGTIDGLMTPSFGPQEVVRQPGAITFRLFQDIGWRMNTEGWIYGTSASETLIGTAANQNLFGLEGDDTLYGRDGNDALYGCAGDDLLYGESGNDILDGGDGDDVLNGGIGDDSIWGGTGNDTYYVDSINDRVTELLDEGTTDTVYSSISYVLGNNLENLNLLASGSSINGTGNSERNIITGNSTDNILDGQGNDDTLYGGAGNDHLYGGDGSDTLYGEVGDDFLVGGSGSDFIDGGNGTDTVSYEDVPVTFVAAGVIVNIDEIKAYQTPGSYIYSSLSSNTVIGFNSALGSQISAGIALERLGSQDTLRNLENIIGSNFDDILIGNSAGNKIQGLVGNDILIGNAGNDTLDGGDGIDTVSYRYAPQAVVVNLEQNTATDGFNGTDQLLNIENIQGSNFSDRLTGNSQINWLFGGSGNDTLEGGGGDDILYGEADSDQLFGGTGNDKLIGGIGADLLNGGDGVDTASYITAINGIVANLSNPQTNTGDAQGDIFISIENLEGSQYDDVLIGNGQNNHLWGLNGNDYLDGFGGNGILEGGLGNDTYKIDTPGTLVIEYLNQGTDTVNASIDYTLGAHLENLNLLEGTTALNGTGNELDNIITGNSANNILNGGDGNDTLYGGLGRDTLIGGNGNDWLVGSSGSDMLTGGSGNDMFVYNSITDAGDMITDFTVGSDKVVLTDVVNSSGWRSVNLLADGFLSTRQASGSLAALMIDPDGAAGGAFRPAPFILFSNVSAAALSSLNNFVV